MDGGGPDIRLAAIVYDDEVDANRLLADFARALMRRGIRVQGLVQQRAAAGRRCDGDVFLFDLDGADDFRISQDLGSEATCCRVDSGAVAEASAVLRRGLAAGADLLVVNKFGKLEAEGGGFADEILTAAAGGMAVVTTVHRRHLEAWRRFCGGLASELPPRAEALDEWWRRSPAVGVSSEV